MSWWRGLSRSVSVRAARSARSFGAAALASLTAAGYGQWGHPWVAHGPFLVPVPDEFEEITADLLHEGFGHEFLAAFESLDAGSGTTDAMP